MPLKITNILNHGNDMTSPQFEKRQCRPRDHLSAAGHHYPNAWKMIDEFRAGKGKDLPNWPDYVLLPLAGFYSIVSADAGVNRLPPHLVPDVGRLAALGTWRLTQGIYRFDSSLYTEIIKTPVDSDLPCEVLRRLPEWCVYVETPDLQYTDSQLYGFFAHLEWDANTGREELRLVLDSENYLQSIPIHLGDWTLTEALQRMADEAKFQAIKLGSTISTAGAASALATIAQPLLSLLLYICSTNAEIGDGRQLPANPQPKKTKNGWRLFPADKPKTWDVGVRLGSALRSAYHARDTEQSGGGNSLRPHIRRAHWHGFWSGSKTEPSQRKFDLKWLPPIPVNLDNIDTLPATIRPAK